MLTLPLNFTPDEVQLVLPDFSVKEFVPASGASKHTFLLGGVYYDGKIRFSYQNIPFCDSNGCRRSSNINTLPEVLEVLDFWMKCQSRHLPFKIDKEHPIWDKSILSNYFISLIKPYHVWYWSEKPSISERVKGFLDISGEFVLKVQC